MFKKIYFSLLLFSLSIAQAADTPWYHSIKRTFIFEGRDAFLIIPNHPLEGNPWIWRAHFPDWHTSMDSILVNRGYHVAYINTNDMYGCPQAMNIWDRFYSYLVNKHHLAPQVVLEGVSRGGLYVHNWAKRNPTKVACIYAESPVCDIKAWPKESFGSEWQELKKMYGFQNDEDVMNYSDNPIDNLQGLAAIGVPILHVISNTDKIVPPEKNTLALVRKYIAQGGPITVIPMKRYFNEENMKGHHYHLDHIEDIVNFMYQNSYPVKHLCQSSAYHNIEGTHPLNCQNVFEQTKKGNIVFFGGSITHMEGWRNRVSDYIQARFPDSDLTFINAGIPSLGSVPHAFRFNSDILKQQIPDLLFLEAAVNDRTNGYPQTDQIRAMEGIIRQAKSINPNMDIVILYFADPDKNGDYDQGIKPQEIENHQQVATHYGIPSVNLAREVYDRIKNGEFRWNEDFVDLHPAPYGQEIYFNSIKTLLDTLWNQAQTTTFSPFIMPPKIDNACFENGYYGEIKSATGTFTYHENFSPKNGQSSRDGFVNVPMLTGENPGEYLQYNFKGNAIGICVTSGKDAGIIEYSIDNTPFQKIDLFTQWSKMLHLPWYLVLGSDLKEKKHTLTIRIVNEKNKESEGNACRIVHFLINGKQ